MSDDSKTSHFGDPSQFLGICDHCGEVYRAHSATDDLEGITFKCRKIVCRGRVTLGYDKNSQSRIGSENIDFELNDPRRYC